MNNLSFPHGRADLQVGHHRRFGVLAGLLLAAGLVLSAMSPARLLLSEKWKREL